MTADEEEAEVRRDEKFYEMVGHCVLRYQQVEDYLETIFAATLGGPAKRAEAIYACVRGVGARSKLIEAAATDRTGAAPWDSLPSLLSRVREVSEVRNHIAHARPVQFTAMTFRVRKENDRIIETVGIDVERRVELRKQAAKREIVYTIEDLRREYGRFHTLLDDMIAFVKSIDAKQ